MRTLTVALVALIVLRGRARRRRASANFVEVETGARAMGMGGAFVAVADDVTALHWNPAGLATLDRIARLRHADERLRRGRDLRGLA